MQIKTKNILLATGAFLLMMSLHFNKQTINKNDFEKKQSLKTLYNNNSDIYKLLYEKQQATLDSLSKIPDFANFFQQEKLIIKYIQENDSLINVAYNLAKKYTIFSTPKKNKYVFNKYYHVYGVPRAHAKYAKNEKHIKDFNNLQNNMEFAKKNIKKYIDSINDIKIKHLLQQNDSILRQFTK